MIMTTRSTRSKYHKENAELWELLRLCQSRLSNKICSEGDELLIGDRRRQKRGSNGGNSPTTRTVQEWEETRDTILSFQEKKLLRDYKREHCEVLDLLERSKERLSKIDFSKLDSHRNFDDDDATTVNSDNSNSHPHDEDAEKGTFLIMKNAVATDDSFTTTTTDSTQDDGSFDIFLDEDLDISYLDHDEEDRQIECEIFGFTFKFFRRQCPDLVTILQNC